MFQVLITTYKTYGTPTVHTHVVQFGTEAEARRAADIINNNKPGAYAQTALLLF